MRGKKFIRREDLTVTNRLQIAFTALMAIKCGNLWGKITQLAKEYMISRMFVYMLAHDLESISETVFGANSQINISEKMLTYQYILSLRLEGKSSLESILTVMQRFGIKNTSIGYISQTLKYFGSLLPNTLSTDNEETIYVVYASDEIFSKQVPILITVDPISSAILRIELSDTRKKEDWKKHWECLETNGIVSLYLVCDEGKGLCGAKEEILFDKIRQIDTYHAIAHQFGQWVKRLEEAAYKAIEAAYEKYKKLDSAKSDRIINKRINKYEEAERIANEKVMLYDTYNDIYLWIIEELKIFDDKGDLRNRTEAEENIKAGLILMEELNIPNITKAVKKVRNTMPDLLNYFDIAKGVVDKLKTLHIEDEGIRVLCLAWQWRKATIKAKKAKAKHYCEDNEKCCLEVATGYLQDDFDRIKEEVYNELNKIIQSSALVECINSIVRPYLNNSKNHITQETLNLIMFYHNHRRYKDGERKGKSPIEMLTKQKQEKDWIEHLLDFVSKKDPSFSIS